ncbi:MAG: pyridoxal phosphate-dependent aminotransferase [Rhizobiaceae bacterium]|nr:pyridoxal phosphate-dependent aminotransferase [Rhizobiaceae bacterium]MCV0405919.1 pyridoxal phosphate-dependent aminotransferase [Rhizobiaceae bacterium]
MYQDHLRKEAREAPESGIVAVANRGRLKPGLIPLWAGEGDLPTPDFIASAAAQALKGGETFYTWQRGIPELREALARYFERHFGTDDGPDNFVVCVGGMQAIQMAIDATCGAGDEAIFFAPAWPNFAGAAGVAGVRPIAVPLDRSPNGWALDMERVAAAVTPRTRAIFVNSPANPTGWTADLDTLKALLDLARRSGMWIIADEIYAHFHYGGGRAPSFIDIEETGDRILYVNSFSKNWAMTGWRMGWVRIPAEFKQVFENLVQYSTSGVPQFLQRGAVVALDNGDTFLAEQVARARHARDLVCRILADTGRVSLTPPQGAFYLMFGIDGVSDSRTAAFDMVENAAVGLAPGSAFGPEGEGLFRLCFHRRLDQIEEAAHRIAGWIGSR